MNDIFGEALLDYQNGNYTEDITTFSSLSGEDTIPLPYLFRAFHEMPLLEKKALELCKGKILDIGCGAGSHSLYLQNKGLEVMALDQSAGAIETCKLRGIANTVQTDIKDYQRAQFDTLLLLMNGIGIAGSINNLTVVLHHLKTLLKPNGQIILDSSDIIYMFDKEDRPFELDPYYGEVKFTMHYKGNMGTHFTWLYISYPRLYEVASHCNLNCELVSRGEHYDYLAILRPLKY